MKRSQISKKSKNSLKSEFRKKQEQIDKYRVKCSNLIQEWQSGIVGGSSQRRSEFGISDLSYENSYRKRLESKLKKFKQKKNQFFEKKITFNSMTSSEMKKLNSDFKSAEPRFDRFNKTFFDKKIDFDQDSRMNKSFGVSKNLISDFRKRLEGIKFNRKPKEKNQNIFHGRSFISENKKIQNQDLNQEYYLSTESKKKI